MLRKIALLAFLALNTAAGLAATTKPPSVQAFFSYPKIADVKISPDGKYLALLVADPKTGDDRKGLVLMATDSTHAVKASFGVKGEQIIVNFWWTVDDRILASTATQTGSFDVPVRDGELYAINPDGSKQMQLMPTEPNRTKLVGGTTHDSEMVWFDGLLSLPQDDPKHALIYGATRGLNGSYNQIAQAYILDLYSGELRKVLDSPVSNGGFITDSNGNIRIATGDNALTGACKVAYRTNGDSFNWKDLSALCKDSDPGNDMIGPVGIAPDNKQLYWLGRTATSTLGLYLLNPDTLSEKALFSDPNVDVYDYVQSFEWSNPKKIIAVETMPGLPQIHMLDPDDPKAQDLASLYRAFTGQMVNIISNTKDHTEMVVRVYSDRNPGEFYLFDTKDGQVRYLFSEKPEIDPQTIPPMLPIEFKSRDGLTIHGYLTLPLGVPAKNLPLIIIPHGGPHGIRDTWGFHPYFPEAAFFASHGYAVMQVNYRGSGGYGREFQDLGYGHWATTMQNDLTDAVQWAIKKGTADPSRICIYGASYGGYAALESSIRFPDLYKCTVGYVGVYDLKLLDDSDFHHYASGKHYIGISIGRDERTIEEDSPVYHTDKLKDALFIIYGGADKRVVPENAEELIAALDKNGKKYQKMYEPNEMHGFYKPEHRYELYTRLLAFFDKYIGPDSVKN